MLVAEKQQCCRYKRYAATQSFQTAIIAQQRTLARQHYKTALNLFETTKVKAELLVGSTSARDKSP